MTVTCQHIAYWLSGTTKNYSTKATKYSDIGNFIFFEKVVVGST